jgi:hypothetical protein
MPKNRQRSPVPKSILARGPYTSSSQRSEIFGSQRLLSVPSACITVLYFKRSCDVCFADSMICTLRVRVVVPNSSGAHEPFVFEHASSRTTRSPGGFWNGGKVYWYGTGNGEAGFKFRFRLLHQSPNPVFRIFVTYDDPIVDVFSCINCYRFLPMRLSPTYAIQ